MNKYDNRQKTCSCHDLGKQLLILALRINHTLTHSKSYLILFALCNVEYNVFNFVFLTCEVT